jgi:hypothetical protein
MTPPSIFAQQGRHSLVSIDLFTTYQSDSSIFPYVLTPANSANLWTLSLRRIWELGWLSNEVLFMAFVPVHKPFYGSLFSRLAYTARTIPVVQLSDGSWALRHDIIQQWDMLERNLRALLTAMHHIIGPLGKKF